MAHQEGNVARAIYGSYRCTVDENRLRLPAKVLAAFGGEAIFVLPGTDKCLVAVAESRSEDVIEKYNNNQTFANDDEARMFTDSIVDIDVDTQGRFSLASVTKKIRPEFNNVDEVVFSGRGNYVEIWPAYVSDKRFGSKFNTADYNKMIANLQATLEGKK